MGQVKTAYDSLLEYLKPGEKVECIVFGYWIGWPAEEPEPLLPPGVKLSLAGAQPYLTSWMIEDKSLRDSAVYTFYAWTTERVIFIYEYDGATGLASIPRHPSTETPTPH